jgi:hypothetical protein
MSSADPFQDVHHHLANAFIAMARASPTASPEQMERMLTLARLLTEAQTELMAITSQSPRASEAQSVPGAGDEEARIRDFGV